MTNYDRISLSSSENEKGFRQKLYRKSKHILCSVTFFENRAVGKRMWKDIVGPDRQQVTIWHMRIARWIPKATNTLSGYVILNRFSTATMVARTHLNAVMYNF